MHSQHFRDFDAFAGSVRDVDCVMLLQNPTHHNWSISHVDLPGVHVQLGRLGGGNIVEGQSWPDGYLFYQPLSDTCAYTANGTVLSKHGFMILEPGCEFCISTKVEHDWCSIFVPARMLAGGGDPAGPAAGSGKTVCRVTPPDRQLADRFRAAVGQIMTAAANSARFESAPASACAAAELQAVAYRIVDQRPPVEPRREGRPKLPRQDIIRRSRELLEERAGAPVRVGQLAAAAGVSERTLRAAFNEYLGVGPVRYLQLRRLHAVHRALRAADPKAVTVSDVLVENGEWEFARFAARYRRLFGELPSQTLRTNRR